MVQQLTPSQENYLEHMWHLARHGSVRVVDLAASVGVKQPSVTRAVNTLASMGLVEHQHYGHIEFTQKGAQAARFIVRRDRCLMDFLTRVLQMAPDAAAAEVCRMEHAISADVLQRLEMLVALLTDGCEPQKKMIRQLARKFKPGTPDGGTVLGADPHV